MKEKRKLVKIEKQDLIAIANHIIETRHTIRETQKSFKTWSTSGIHAALKNRLPEIEPSLWNSVSQILEYHTSVRHLRGGEATKMAARRKALRKASE